MNEVLRVEHLSHSYSVGTPFEKKAVDDVSFSAQRGEFIGLIGHQIGQQKHLVIIVPEINFILSDVASERFLTQRASG